MLNRHRSQFGLTLVELLVALFASLVVIAGATSIYLTSIRLESDNIHLARLNQDMRSLMDVMVRDIRRAGFLSSDPVQNSVFFQNNPFFSDETDIRIHDQIHAARSCIVYSYNRNNDTPPVVGANEYLGFRVNPLGRIEMRQGGSSNNFCGSSDDLWVVLSSPGVKVNALSFDLEVVTLNVSSMMTDANNDRIMDGDTCLTSNADCQVGGVGNGFCDLGEVCTRCENSGEHCLDVRVVAISLSAEHSASPEFHQTIRHQVRIPNDRLFFRVAQ